MSSFIQILVSGLATGAIYALIAAGFTLLWQTSQTINFAQGEFVMLPAFFVLAAMNAGAPFWLAAVIGIALAVVVLGLLFKLVVVDPMLRHGVLPLVISTIALSLFLKESVKASYSSQAQPFPQLVPAVDIEILGAVMSTQSLVVLAAAIVTVVALHLVLNKTRLGRAMQATAQNPTLALILGVPVRRMVLYTFLINAVLVAIASILVSPIYLAGMTAGESAVTGTGSMSALATIAARRSGTPWATMGSYTKCSRRLIAWCVPVLILAICSVRTLRCAETTRAAAARIASGTLKIDDIVNLGRTLSHRSVPSALQLDQAGDEGKKAAHDTAPVGQHLGPNCKIVAVMLARTHWTMRQEQCRSSLKV
jgi:branched-chain amino acid transport system permease protein